MHVLCVQRMGTLYTFSEEFSSVLCMNDAAASLCVLEAPFGLKRDIFHWFLEITWHSILENVSLSRRVLVFLWCQTACPCELAVSFLELPSPFIPGVRFLWLKTDLSPRLP